MIVVLSWNVMKKIGLNTHAYRTCVVETAKGFVTQCVKFLIIIVLQAVGPNQNVKDNVQVMRDYTTGNVIHREHRVRQKINSAGAILTVE